MPRQNVLLNSYRAWLASQRPNRFLTFNFGYKVSIEVGGQSVVRFLNRLQRNVHGRNWNSRQTKKHMIVAGFWEHVDSNPHLHVVARLYKDERVWLRKDGRAAWLERQKRGQLDFSKIESLERVISYITKEFDDEDFQERMFTYKAPLDK